MNSFVYAYITMPNIKTARKFSEELVRRRFVACTNIIPKMESLYWWKGKIERANESILIAKTRSSNYEKVRKYVEKNHPYTTPCIVKINVSSNKKYFDWLMGEL